MNYIPIHTNVFPSYNYLSAENAYLKQALEYKSVVLCEQQAKIAQLEADVVQLSQASATFKKERDQHADDAQRWKIMQRIIKTQGNDQKMYEVTKIVDKEMERERTGSLEPSNRRSA